LAYVRLVREKIRRLFRLPWIKAPWRWTTLGELRFDGFRMESALYSRRAVRSANLYVPDGLSAPAPPFLSSAAPAEGKAGPIYRRRRGDGLGGLCRAGD
jgi:hypothetical protein